MSLAFDYLPALVSHYHVVAAVYPLDVRPKTLIGWLPTKSRGVQFFRSIHASRLTVQEEVAFGWTPGTYSWQIKRNRKEKEETNAMLVFQSLTALPDALYVPGGRGSRRFVGQIGRTMRSRGVIIQHTVRSPPKSTVKLMDPNPKSLSLASAYLEPGLVAPNLLCRSWGSHHGWLSCQQAIRPKIEAKHHTDATGTSLHRRVPATWDAVMGDTLSPISTDVMDYEYNMDAWRCRLQSALHCCLPAYHGLAGLDFVSTNHGSQSAPSPTLWFAGIAFGNRMNSQLELETRNQTFRPDSRNPANASMGNSSCSRLCPAALRWTCFSYLSFSGQDRSEMRTLNGFFWPPSDQRRIRANARKAISKRRYLTLETPGDLRVRCRMPILHCRLLLPNQPAVPLLSTRTGSEPQFPALTQHSLQTPSTAETRKQGLPRLMLRVTPFLSLDRQVSMWRLQFAMKKGMRSNPARRCLPF
ncbi:uncharacterized protein CLUP02_11469 [Colletotrichum lupini]|uniref:Uncharacterized protein n=1 Tax=Colletotrichum lupini TaxID=145971 RepID=A0A9Q8WKH9_9PEZI|nr:uncharacterized protein CLUP02_11469 [Colletotrichum lupini]UQC85970.1 hypothetical protein CLUP02_11469 [Colletotrichum lupini]